MLEFNESFAPKKKNLSVFRHCCFAESFVTTKNSFGLHLVNDIFYDLNGGDITGLRVAKFAVAHTQRDLFSVHFHV